MVVGRVILHRNISFLTINIYFFPDSSSAVHHYFLILIYRIRDFLCIIQELVERSEFWFHTVLEVSDLPLVFVPDVEEDGVLVFILQHQVPLSGSQLISTTVKTIF